MLASSWWVARLWKRHWARAHGCSICEVLLVFVVFSAPWAGAARGDPGGWQLRTASKIRHNPIGVGLQPELSWRLPLSRSDHPLLRGTGVETGFLAKISPASFHPGLYVEAVPLSLLVFRAQLQQLRYFGFFGHLAEYEGKTPDWSPATREGEQATGRHATGWTAATSMTLRLKVGRFVVRGRAARQWLRMRVSLDHAWYDSTSDLIYAPRDRLDRLESTAGAIRFRRTRSAVSTCFSAGGGGPTERRTPHSNGTCSARRSPGAPAGGPIESSPSRGWWVDTSQTRTAPANCIWAPK